MTHCACALPGQPLRRLDGWRTLECARSAIKTAMHRFGKCSFYRPPKSQPVLDGGLSNSELCAQVRKAISDSIDRQDAVMARVPALFLLSSPFAIRWFVIPIVVLSFDRKTIGAFPHISKKQLERIPSFTHGDSPSSIPWVCASAPTAHTQPNTVRPVLGGAGGVAVNLSGFRGSVPLKASARPCFALNEIRCFDNHGLSAVTDTHAPGLSTMVMHFMRACYDKSCKSGSWWDSFPFRHIIGSFNGLFSGRRAAYTVRRPRHYRSKCLEGNSI